MGLVQRFDATRLDKVDRLPSGALRVDSRPTRTGVFAYRRLDGTTVRELRHPDEVFAAPALASLAGVPLTIEHPAKPVTPETWASVAVGHVGDDPRADGEGYVAARLVVQRADACAAVLDGRLTELSCGYECDMDPTPGVFEGQPYDAVQRGMVYNHLAMLPAGQGRMGPNARIKTDSVDVADTTAWRIDAADEPRKVPMGKITLDGIEYDRGSDSHLSALDRALAAAVKRADTAEGTLAAVNGTLAETKAALAIATDPKTIAVKVAARADTLSKVARLYRSKGLRSDAPGAAAEPAVANSGDLGAIVRATLMQLYPGIIPDGASDDFVAGIFVAKLGGLAADEATEPDAAPLDGAGMNGGAPGAADMGGGSNALTLPRADALSARAMATARGTDARADSVADSIAKANADRNDAWKRPLTGTKG